MSALTETIKDIRANTDCSHRAAVHVALWWKHNNVPEHLQAYDNGPRPGSVLVGYYVGTGSEMFVGATIK